MIEVAFTLTGPELPDEQWIRDRLEQLFKDWELEIDEITIYEDEE